MEARDVPYLEFLDVDIPTVSEHKLFEWRKRPTQEVKVSGMDVGEWVRKMIPIDVTLVRQVRKWRFWMTKEGEPKWEFTVMREQRNNLACLACKVTGSIFDTKSGKCLSSNQVWIS